MTTSEGFPGEGRNADEDAFLARLRRCAATSGLLDVEPTATHVHVLGEIPLVGCVVVPGMADSDSQGALQVGWDASATDDQLFVGEWTGEHDYLIDGWDQEDIDVTGVEPTPERMAELAYEWLVDQLGHPVVRLDWHVDPDASRSEWYFADTGRRLWDDGFRWRRSLRRPWRRVEARPEPDMVTRLR